MRRLENIPNKNRQNTHNLKETPKGMYLKDFKTTPAFVQQVQ